MATFDPYFQRIEYVHTPLLPEPVAPRSPLASIHARMLLILSVVLLLIVPLLVKVLPGQDDYGAVVVADASATVQTQAAEQVEPVAVPLPQEPPLGDIQRFHRRGETLGPTDCRRSQEFGVDPNLTAIIMQIESCGDPQAVSHAGAQGLFQVMPFHFAAGEDSLDPDTNARRGINYFVERLNQTNRDIGRAFAGYNGGHVAAGNSWDQWADETQRYFRWSTGIYEDIQAGRTDSPTLQAWLQAGGASLCRQAAQRLGLSS